MLTIRDLRAHTGFDYDILDDEGNSQDRGAIGIDGFGIYGGQPPGSGTIAKAHEQITEIDSWLPKATFVRERWARDLQRGFAKKLRSTVAAMDPADVGEYLDGLADQIRTNTGSSDYVEILTAPEVAATLNKLRARYGSSAA